MESNIIRLPYELTESSLQFASSPSVTSTKAVMIGFTHNNQPLYFQTSLVECPIGFRVFEQNANKSYKLLFNPTDDIISFVENVDNIVVDQILANSKKWFGKEFGARNIVETLFYPTVRTTNNYPPSMNARMRFNRNTGLPMFTVFDASRQEIVFSPDDGPERLTELLKAHTNVRMILGNASVWGVNGRYGYGWDCVQIQICSSSILANVKQCLITDDYETEDTYDNEEENPKRTKY